jgi:hypothetical protein
VLLNGGGAVTSNGLWDFQGNSGLFNNTGSVGTFIQQRHRAQERR